MASFKDAMERAVRAGEVDAMTCQTCLWSAFSYMFSELDVGDKVKALSYAEDAKNAAERAQCWANDLILMLNGEDPYGDVEFPKAGGAQ